MYRVTQDSWISSSHQVSREDGTLEPLHGHNWRVRATIDADSLDARGLVVDLDDLKRRLDEVLDALDHLHLNDLPGFDRSTVSAEHLAQHVCERLVAQIDDDRCRVSQVRVWMTDARSASFCR
jgi:6-pyruvoyltetrahydropterin/6-carboxytetrahydropterin synthase